MGRKGNTDALADASFISRLSIMRYADDIINHDYENE